MPAGMVPVMLGRLNMYRSVNALKLDRNPGKLPYILGIPLIFL